jgi:hypothetical protein
MLLILLVLSSLAALINFRSIKLSRQLGLMLQNQAREAPIAEVLLSPFVCWAAFLVFLMLTVAPTH